MNGAGYEGEKIAAIVVDIQGDFTEFKKGSLAVPNTGEDYIEVVGEAAKRCKEAGFLMIATQDWHPPNHISFYTNHPGKSPGDVIQRDGRTQNLWPPHCVEGTENAGILVESNLFSSIVKKGRRPEYDSYSGFQDDGGDETELHGLLQKNNVRKILIFGLATDYCVKYTALDGIRKGYKVIAIENLSRGITPETTVKALAEIERLGAVIMKDLDMDRIRAL